MHDCRSRPARGPGRHAPRRQPGPLVLAALCALVTMTSAVGEARGSSAARELRRGRLALVRGAQDAAQEALSAAQSADPGSAWAAEASVLLADLHFSASRPELAQAVLDRAQSAARGAAATTIGLARGWLALSRNEVATARQCFSEPRRAPSHLARAAAELGLAWCSLAEEKPIPNENELRAIARKTNPPALRFIAGWTLARSLEARGEPKRSRRELRKLRRPLRATTYADDLELAIGLAELRAGHRARAHRVLKRLAQRFDGGGEPRSQGLRLADLHGPPRDLVPRASALYAERTAKSAGLIEFLAGLLDRRAAADVPAALLLSASIDAEQAVR